MKPLKPVAYAQWLVFWSFVVIKGFGTALAAWSWWWALVPVVPVLALIFQRWGLL